MSLRSQFIRCSEFAQYEAKIDFWYSMSQNHHEMFGGAGEIEITRALVNLF